MFLEKFGSGQYIQAVKIRKLLGIANASQYLDNNKVHSVKFAKASTGRLYVTVSGAVQILIKRNFGGNKKAAELYYANDDLSDADRVCLVLGFLESQSPGILELKPVGPKGKRDKRLAA